MHQENMNSHNNDRLEKIVSETKTIIRNMVLENPWKPKIPSYNIFSKVKSKSENQKLKTVTSLQCTKKEPYKIFDDAVNKPQKEPLPVKLNTLDILSVTTDINENDVKCHLCNETFISADLLDVHIRRHSTPRHTCGECGKSFSQLRNFKYHMSVHRGTREFSATCSVCGKHFNDRSYLSSHMKIHRNRKEYQCSHCPKSFNQRVAYNMHLRIHTGVKPHVCEECGKAFSRKMLLSQHKRTHSGERPYACSLCDKRFADRSNMRLHRKLHTGVKPFSCSLCSKSFSKKHHLVSHQNFHVGAKPYSCPKCHLAFTQSSNMRTHYKKCSIEN